MGEQWFRYALRIAFIGSNYKGSQRQPEVETIEGVLLNALKTTKIPVDDTRFNFKACGRTDAGVHALSWVVAFDTPSPPIVTWINSVLPKQVKIWAIARVPNMFHPRFDAVERTYTYVIPKPQTPLQLEPIRTALDLIVGTHDFSYFSKPSPEVPSTLCTVKRTRIQETPEGLVFTFTADRFLWHMVRKLATALLGLGLGTIDLEEFRSFLTPSGPRTFPNIQPAPAEGLILSDVSYALDFDIIPEGAQATHDLFYYWWEKSAMNTTLAKTTLELINALWHFHQ